MTSEAKTDIVITPATWRARVEQLEQTPTDLLNVVGWYGSTHQQAMWRKDKEFLDVFRDRGVAGFDPQIDDWDPSFIDIEAEVMAHASVLIIRLENNELLNGSLGSIAEIGVALTSAALRGQFVIVSVEDNLLTSLDEPGAVAQYMVLEMSLEHFDQDEITNPFFDIHRGDDLQELAAMACEAAQRQMADGPAGLDFQTYLEQRSQRRKNHPLHVVMSGSGGPYSKIYQDSFFEKRDVLRTPCLAKGYKVKDLSEGAIAQAWEIPYGSLDNIAAAMAMRTISIIELEYKQEADLLLVPIMSEAASKAAVTWIGFLLLNALITGQDVKIFFEPFDPVDYIYRQLAEVNAESNDEASVRRALQQAGVPDMALALATQSEVMAAIEILKAMADETERPSFKAIKKSLLGQTEAFQRADNIRRVRALVEGHLERLHTDERFPDFFYYSNKVT